MGLALPKDSGPDGQEGMITRQCRMDDFHVSYGAANQNRIRAAELEGYHFPGPYGVYGLGVNTRCTSNQGHTCSEIIDEIRQARDADGDSWKGISSNGEPGVGFLRVVRDGMPPR